MKKINFKYLKIENLFSIGSVPVEINFNDGINLISGINKDELGTKNGVGKSLILNSFYFAIFGENISKMNKKFMVNRKNKSNAKVELIFTAETNKGIDEYKIVRSISPNKLFIYKNKEDISLDSMANSTDYILDILSANEEVFKSCIIMRINNTIPFMSKSKVDKKEFIESIFNLDIFSKMNKIARDYYNDSKKNYDIENSKLYMLNSNFEKYKNEYSLLEEKIKKDYENNISKKKEIKKNIKIKKEEYDSLKKSIVKLEDNSSIISSKEELILELDKKINECSEELNNLHTKEVLFKSKIVDLNSNEYVCKACGRPFDIHSPEEIEKHKSNNNKIKIGLEKINNLKNDLKEKISFYKSEIKNINQNIKELNSLKNKNLKIDYDLKIIKNTLEYLCKEYKTIDLKKTDNGLESINNIIIDTKKDIDNESILVKSSEEKMKHYDICKFILSEEGVRSYIVGKLLEILNNRIKFYLQEIKSKIDFSFNEFFEEEIKDSDNNVCMYNNCSGAESKKIDMAVSFAFLDILKLQGNVEYNVEFYDEILDTSFDNKNLEIILDVIRRRIEDNKKCAYIITHKTDINIPISGEHILLQKENGYTTRLN